MSQTILGFDFGTRKIGIAVGQTQTATAQGIATLFYNHYKVPWDEIDKLIQTWLPDILVVGVAQSADGKDCLLYTSPSPRDGLLSRMPSSA